MIILICSHLRLVSFVTLNGKENFFFQANCCGKFNSVCHLRTDVGLIFEILSLSYMYLQPFFFCLKMCKRGYVRVGFSCQCKKGANIKLKI